MVSIAGDRCEDIFSYLRSNNLDTYNYVIIFCGGNGLSVSVKNSRIRSAVSPNEKKNIENIAWYLHNMEIRVFVVGIPKRRNTSCGDIYHLNCLLRSSPHYYHFVGIGSNMSSENILRHDGIHLNERGLSQLTSIINKKIFRYLNNEWFHSKLSTMNCHLTYFIFCLFESSFFIWKWSFILNHYWTFVFIRCIKFWLLFCLTMQLCEICF